VLKAGKVQEPTISYHSYNIHKTERKGDPHVHGL
jgi:hypothetical protein